MGMGLFFTPLAVWMGLFLCSWVLDSHYAGRRVTVGRHWQGRSSPIAKNTGVECECIISTISLPAETTTHRNIMFRSAHTSTEVSWSLLITASMHHTHMSLSSPLRRNVAVAGRAGRPIRSHRDWMGGNWRWWWSCQQSSCSDPVQE